MKNFVLILLLGLTVATAMTAGAIISKKNTELGTLRQEKTSLETKLENRQPVIGIDPARFKDVSTAEFEGKHVTFRQKVGGDGVTVEIRESDKPFNYDTIRLSAKEAEIVANELASGLLGIKYDAFSCTTTQPVVK